MQRNKYISSKVKAGTAIIQNKPIVSSTHFISDNMNNTYLAAYGSAAYKWQLCNRRSASAGLA